MCEKGNPKPSQVIIKQNSQMRIDYICLYPLSRKINSRQNCERTYLFP